MTVVASSKTLRSVLAVNPENHGAVWICRLKVEGLGRRWRLCIELWRCLSAPKCLAHSQRLVLAVVLLWFCGIFAPIHLAEVATRSCHSVVAYSVACGRQGATTICFVGCFKVCAATPATIFCCWVPRVDHRWVMVLVCIICWFSLCLCFLFFQLMPSNCGRRNLVENTLPASKMEMNRMSMVKILRMMKGITMGMVMFDEFSGKKEKEENDKDDNA